jgi:hypothetical protein
MEEHISNKRCLNCESVNALQAIHCHACGQKFNDNFLNIKELINDFFGSIFNLDSRVYQTIKMIFVPGYLTKAYVSGKRHSFISPIRLFLVSLIFTFTLIALTLDTDNFKMYYINMVQDNYKAELLEMCDSISLELNWDRQELIDLDTFKLKLFGKSAKSTRDTFPSWDVTFFNMVNIREFGISNSDALRLPAREIFKKYNVTRKTDKLIVGQALKITQNPGAALRFAVSNLVWGVFLVTIFTALFLKLLYIRRKRYYVEHLVLLMHHHSFAFFIVSFFYLIPSLLLPENYEIPGIVILIAISLIFLYIVSSLKIFYQQGWLKTLVKFFLVFNFYFLAIIIFLTVVMLLSLMLM